HWVYGPDTWTINDVLSTATPVCGGFYVNPRNLYHEPDEPHRSTITENLMRNAVALFAAISEHRQQLPGVPLPVVTPALEGALDALLASGDHLLDGVARQVLEKHKNQPDQPTAQPERA